uniref:Histidine--tRNA ligase, chloroplastic n=1 Tax=Acrosorium ciliolatum TaxID=1550622 RepID=A0A1Z1M2F3_9FLOR|nr:Histidine-tRNA ligase [Acrosorium ciliolatum]ARW60092.1 Histidine-tRNA ligase [Acrosorium ciliolatum]
MQSLRGTTDILPDEINMWQEIYTKVHELLTLASYNEIRTPIIENTNLFKRSIGNNTDIINKEMYSFQDQGNRNITLRPEGTASIARAFISNQLYINKQLQRLWYLGPMFRYERPQYGRQRQFHQLGIECIGSFSPMADVEVIRLAINILKILQCKTYNLEINSIGNTEERHIFKDKLIEYLIKYENDLDNDSKKRLYINPLRILDSKDIRTQEILIEAPQLYSFLQSNSLKHFNEICEHLEHLNIEYNINKQLVRGLDYYNYTAFEIKTKEIGNQDTICGGGRYDTLIEQLGGPKTPSVGWAIGIERLLIIIKDKLNIEKQGLSTYIAIQGDNNKKYIWKIIEILENCKIKFELDLSNNNLQKQLKKANKSNATICLIIGENEIINKNIIIKYLKTGYQEKIQINNLHQYLYSLKN